MKLVAITNLYHQAFGKWPSSAKVNRFITDYKISIAREMHGPKKCHRRVAPEEAERVIAAVQGRQPELPLDTVVARMPTSTFLVEGVTRDKMRAVLALIPGASVRELCPVG